jgi:DNA-binding IscR family transcriptional regulator
MSTNSRFAVAVHVLSLMAWSGEEPLKSEQVAESVNTNPVVIRRMLLDLAQAGLVVSQTGSMGGSRLATDPAKTTLLDVYQALECGGVFRCTGSRPAAIVRLASILKQCWARFYRRSIRPSNWC